MAGHMTSEPAESSPLTARPGASSNSPTPPKHPPRPPGPTGPPCPHRTERQSMATSDEIINSRAELTAAIIEAKERLDLSWQDLADGTGLNVAYVTAAL